MNKLKNVLQFLWWNGPGMFVKYHVSIKYIFNNPVSKNSKLELLLKILWWKVNKIFFKLPVMVQLSPKIKCICYPDATHYGSLVLYTTFPEYSEMMITKKILEKEDIFFDVGANIGIYSLIAASKITTGKIYAFEPSAKSLPYLYENIFLNQLGDKVKVIEKVVSDKNGFLSFDISGAADYNHISYSQKSSAYSSNNKVDSKKDNIRLPSITLDDFISKNKIPHIKLIKIDVEGTEILVLKGLEKSLRSKLIDVLIVEVSEWTFKKFSFSPEEVYKFLRKYDFNLYYFSPKNKLKKLSKTLEGNWNVIAIHKSKMHLL